MQFRHNNATSFWLNPELSCLAFWLCIYMQIVLLFVSSYCKRWPMAWSHRGPALFTLTSRVQYVLYCNSAHTKITMPASIPTKTAACGQQRVTLTREDDFLLSLGRRVRQARNRRGLTRKMAAREADVSERHLAQLEAGEGNVSVVLLRRIAAARPVTLVELFAPEVEEPGEKQMIQRFLERLPNHRLEDVVFRLMRDFSPGEKVRRKRIALIGLRGAGKSTLGSKLALEMRVPFIELDGEIEKDTGMPLA